MKKLMVFSVLMLFSICESVAVIPANTRFFLNGIYYYGSGTSVGVSYRGDTWDAYTNEYTGDVIIPTSVVLSNTVCDVTRIDGSAFRGFTELNSVTIPNSVTSIGVYAFLNCTGLTAVTIPNNVTTINNYAFENCSSLTSVTIPESINEINTSTFQNCSSLTSVTIPNNVASIDNDAFSGCTSLTSVYLSNILNNIGTRAFENCSSLTSITIPGSVTTIKGQAFNGCNNLTTVIVERGTPISISSDVFSNRANAILFVPSGRKAAYQAADYWKEFKMIIEMSQSSETISFADAYVKALCVQNWDFNGDGEISDYEAAAVTDLGEVFKGNTTITSFDELQCFTGLTTINTQAFNDCTNLTSIVIPANVETIDYMAFSGCSNITSIVIPSNVTYIGDDAFRGTGLTSIDIPDNVTTMKSCCFAGCNNLVSATIGSGVTTYDSSALIDNPSLTSIVVSQENQVYDSRNGCNAVIRKSDNVLLTGCNNTVIPNGITGIFTYAFRGCIGLTSMTIPNSVMSIGEQAFCNCQGLTSVTIPKSVTSIGKRAFKDCRGLTAVHISDLDAWFGIDFNHNNLSNPLNWAHHLYLNGEEIKNLVVPSSVSNIHEFAFYGCTGFTSVTIPNSVTSIGQYAFGYTSFNSMTVGWNTPISINSNVFYIANTDAKLYVPYGTLSAYESASVWSDFHDIVELSSVSFTMNNLGMATFSNSTGLDFTNVQGLKAYIASGFSPSTGKLLLTRVDKVPANEGLVLKGEAGDYEIPFTTTDMYYSNLLVGVPTATTVSPTKGEYTNFILANGKYGVSFYTLSQEGIISDGKAYLQLPTSMLSNLSKGMVMAFDDEQDEATGIKDVDRDIMSDNHCYNLNGQRVDKIQRGVYIIDGKKVLIK